MGKRARYPPGVPCWVETLQPDPEAALAFYGPLFEWEFVGLGATQGDAPGRYFVAQVEGLDVAGIGSRRNQPQAPAWCTYVRVASLDDTAEEAFNAGGALPAGPCDALPARPLAILADPAGAEIGIWEAAAREGAQLVNEPRAWALSELHTSDVESANIFYEALFGWQPEPFGPRGAQTTLWRLPGYVGGVPQQPVPRDVVGLMHRIATDGAPGPEDPHWSVEFWVDDVDAAAEHGDRRARSPERAVVRRRVDAADDAVRILAAHDRAIGLAGKVDIVGKPALSGHQHRVFAARHRLSDDGVGVD